MKKKIRKLALTRETIFNLGRFQVTGGDTSYTTSYDTLCEATETHNQQTCMTCTFANTRWITQIGCN